MKHPITGEQVAQALANQAASAGCSVQAVLDALSGTPGYGVPHLMTICFRLVPIAASGARREQLLAVLVNEWAGNAVMCQAFEIEVDDDDVSVAQTKRFAQLPWTFTRDADGTTVAQLALVARRNVQSSEPVYSLDRLQHYWDSPLRLRLAGAEATGFWIPHMGKIQEYSVTCTVLKAVNATGTTAPELAEAPVDTVIPLRISA